MKDLEARAKDFGFTIVNEGPTCWYALLPGETQFRHVERRDGMDDVSYIGFFRTKPKLLEELERILDRSVMAQMDHAVAGGQARVI